VSTTPLHRFCSIAVASLVAAGLLTGCGGKTKAAAASSASAPQAPAAASATSSVTATGGGKFCQQVASSINQGVAAAAAAGTNSDDVKTQVQQTQALEAGVLKGAPAAIKSDLSAVFDATNKLDAALAKAGYDYSKIDPTAFAAFSSPDVVAAEQHLTSYMKSTCGIDVGGVASGLAAPSS
jgi:hypothetical protein